MGNTSSSAIEPPPDKPPPSACPVDPSARAAWLDAAAKDQPNPSRPPFAPSAPPTTNHPKLHPLDTNRVTSSIPRGAHSPATTTPTPTSAASPPTTNWIYPSEKMFFEALRRKNHDPSAADMTAVVPIHNAVNERAWAEIKGWEARFAASENARCGGPRLRSFAGDSRRVSPRARWLGLWGYESPFDRHDWVVERCGGGEVEYVIDFYRGRGGGLAFYLDVRPRLNSWEGWRMRLGRLVGM